MKLRLGQPVHADDGLFGEVGDIIIDPHEKKVTHLVVEPHHQHQQARLVPMWLVTVTGDDVHVGLDIVHLRQLQRVAYSDFVRFGDNVAVGDDWDIGTERVIAMPYFNSWKPGFSGTFFGDQIDVAYDRIPKGECEIRRTSRALSSDDHVVGHVEGFIADEDHLTGVVLRAGLPGLSHNFVIPMSVVEAVRNDEITLSLDKATFSKLPRAEGLSGPLADHSALDDLGEKASQLADSAIRGAAKLADRAKKAFRDEKLK